MKNTIIIIIVLGSLIVGTFLYKMLSKVETLTNDIENIKTHGIERYQVVMGVEMKGVFKIDTQTGRIWLFSNQQWVEVKDYDRYYPDKFLEEPQKIQ